MNQNKQKQPPRNITPNFLRFKRTTQTKTGKSSGKNQTSEQPRQEQRNNQKSHSKASKCSFEVYQKRVLNLSKLKNTLNLKRKKLQETSVDPSKKKGIHDQPDNNSRRTNSNNKNQQDFERENIMVGFRGNERLLERKRSSGSGKVLRPTSRERLSNPKRTEQSLDKQQQRAKLMNVELINNLMHHQHVPNYMNKLKIKKTETYQKKKPTKRKFINCKVDIKSQQEIKNYQFFGELGKGAYGVVRMGINKRNGQKVAIKVYQKKRLDEVNKIKNLEREVDILSSLDHPIIAKLLDTIQTQGQIYLIMEYGGANSLYNYLLSKSTHRLDEFEAKNFFKTIAQTLKYLHDKNIVHRDIKAENILLNRHQQLKLIDFGFSLQSKAPSTIDTFCGTPTYMAPQIVSKKDHVPIYTDMWSMGILFYVMLQGNYPFRAKNENDLFEKIKRGHFQYLHQDISEKAKSIIESLLRVNPLQRLTVNQLLTKQLCQWYSTK